MTNDETVAAILELTKQRDGALKQVLELKKKHVAGNNNLGYIEAKRSKSVELACEGCSRSYLVKVTCGIRSSEKKTLISCFVERFLNCGTR